MYEQWLQLLLHNATQPDLFRNAISSMAFYADILGPAAQVANILSMGAVTDSDDAEKAFLGAGLRQMAKAAAISDQEIETAADEAAELQVVAQSGVVGRTLVGALAALEHRIPSAGILGVRVLKEAYVYLTQPATQNAVDARVKAELTAGFASGDPVIVISHSLGTVIAFRLLRELRTSEAPLLITMGSPLTIAAVKNRVGLPTGRPANIKRWANYYDKGDVVALGQGLVASNFGPGIDNDDDVNNQTANAHSIDGYLNHSHIIRLLEQTLA